MLVAASDALAATIAAADFACDGANDEVQINAAIAALHANGGVVHLSEGTFEVTPPLQLTNAKSVTLQGEGALVTILNMTGPNTQDAIQLVSGYHHQVKDLGITGTYRVGVLLQDVAYCQVEELRITGPALAGVRAETGNFMNAIRSVDVQESTYYGFWMYGNNNLVKNCCAIRAASGGLAGFRIQDSGSTYVSPVVDRHEYGLHVTQYAVGTTIVGPYLERCGRGVRVQSAATPFPEAITINGGFVFGCTGTYPAIDVENGSVVIEGPVVTNTVGAKDLEVHDGAVARLIGLVLDGEVPSSFATGAHIAVL